MQVLADMPTGKLLLLLIPILMFGGCCFTLAVGMVASQFDNGPTKKKITVENTEIATPAEKKLAIEVEAAPATAKVRVIVFDDTVKKPIPRRAEIWFRGLGSWWLSRDTGPKTLGPREIGQLLEGDDTLVIYPNGRGSNDEGRRIDVPIKLTTEMNPEGSPRDAVTIEISDTVFTIGGLPVKAANQSKEIVIPRK